MLKLGTGFDIQRHVFHLNMGFDIDKVSFRVKCQS